MYDPASTLTQLAAGNAQYGTIQVAAIDPIPGFPNFAIGATTVSSGTFARNDLSVDGSPFVTHTMTITMNSNALNKQFPPGNDFGVNRDTRNALDVLHELGHAITGLSGGAGSSGIMHDGPQVPGGMLLSSVNTVNVAENCLH